MEKPRFNLPVLAAGILIGMLLVVLAGLAAGLNPFKTTPGSSGSEVPSRAPSQEPLPSPTPILSDLYTFFPPPRIGISRTYNYSYVYARYDESMTIIGYETETGSFTETIMIVNQDFSTSNVTIMGVQIEGKAYMAPCDAMVWVVYDSLRLYYICKQDYVFNAAAEMSGDPAPYLSVGSQYSDKGLDLKPDYLAPFEIGKYWDSSQYGDEDISVANLMTKTTAYGTYENCYQFRLFAPNFNELRYLCPGVGLVAVEVYDHDDYYSAELVSLR